MRPALRLKLLALAACASTACSSCNKGEATPPSGPAGSPAAGVEVGDRLSFSPPELSAADLEGYPVPVPVESVARVAAIPRLAPAAEGDIPEASRPRAANKAVEISLVSVTQSRTLPGMQAPPGKAFVVLHTRWKNIHPRKLLRKEDLKPDRTMGVGTFASGGQVREKGPSDDTSSIEADVAYQVPRIEDHAWLLADGSASAVDLATPRLHLGAPYGRPITLPRLDDTRDLRLAYLVDEGARDLAFRFFDNSYGDVSLPVRGAPERAQGQAALPGQAQARGRVANLDVAVLQVQDVASFRGVPAPEGWRFVRVQLAGLAGPTKDGAAIVQLDPRKYLWLTSTDGQVRFASGGSLSPLGLLRFPPGLLQRHEVVFSVPKASQPARLSVRSGAEVATLSLGKDVEVPAALVSAKDGETMEVKVLGLWRGAGAREDELVLDVAVENRVKGQGLELSERQFTVAVERGPVATDGQRTAELVLRPPSPFVIPPGTTARFQLAFATTSPPTALVVDGFQGKLELPLASVKESEVEPVHGDPSRRADDLVERLALPADDEEGEGAPVLAFATPIPAQRPVAEEPPPFPDDREPNDTAEGAGLLGEDGEAKGSFDLRSGVDTDFYRFTVTGDPALYSLEAEGAELSALGYQGMSRTNEVRVQSVDGRGAVRDLYLRPGTHFVSVTGRPKQGTTGPSTYTVRLVRQGARAEGYEGEPNDTGQRGQRILFGETRRGRIAHESDRDVYLFSVVKAEPVSIQLRGPAESIMRLEVRGTGVARPASSVSKGAPIDYRTILRPGDYELLVYTRDQSLASYELVIHRLDPFVATGDLEPNDDPEHASDLPPDRVATGNALDSGDRDVYRLPPGEGGVLFTRSGTDVRLLLRDGGGRWVPLEPLGEGDLRVRGTLPKGGPALLMVDAEGPYSVDVRYDTGAPPEPLRLPVALTLGAPPGPLAAWWHEAQRLELPLTLESPEAQDVALRVWTSHPDWRAEVAPRVSLAPGKKASVKVGLTVAPDASSDVPVRVVVEARSPRGERSLASTELRATCGATPVGAHAARPLPAALLGGLDVASSALGGKALSTGRFSEREPLLLSGLVTLDHDFTNGSDRLPFELTFDLAGEAPVEVAGFLLHPPGAMARNDVNSLRDFEVLLSQDGTTFTPALRGTLEEAMAEQAFVLPSPVSARFARLRFESEWAGRSSSVGLAMFKVVARPESSPDVARSGLNLADPKAGGHVVWADPSLDRPREMLTVERERPTYGAEPAREASFVVGFQHERAARVRALEWEEPADPLAPGCVLQAARVSVSTASPFGPWSQVGTWKLERDASGVARLGLEQPVWARYVQVSLSPPSRERVRCRMPETLRILEEAPSGSYRSALGEWGHAARSASFELQQAEAPVSRGAAVAVHATRERALALKLEAAHPDSVARGEDEDWYRLEIPEGQNTLALSLASDAPSRLEWRLEGEDGTPVPLADSAGPAGVVLLRAQVVPGKVYFLRIGEPRRSIVFAWDASGSVTEYQPQIYQALSRFAAAVRPEREQVHLLPFGAKRALTSVWANDPYTLLEAVTDYDERFGSSDAEGALLQASELLGAATGSRAVLTVTDDDSGASPEAEARLWASLGDVRPRVFAVQIPLGGDPTLFQDRMQTWARVNDGHYGAFRTREDLALSFDRATCLLRRPVEYVVTAKGSYETPPSPGRLVVRRKGAPEGTAFEIIYDASGSMYQKLGGTTRLAVAREAIGKLVRTAIPPGTPVALRAYGHLQPRTCKTQLVVPLRAHDPRRLIEVIRRIEPQDRSGTPIAESLAAVAEDLRGAGKQKVVVLVTDGEESCGGDPGAAIQALRASGIDVRLNIVGFAVSKDAERGFARWAEWGGGRYYEAKNGEELARAMEQALNPAFQVVDASGRVVTNGTVNGVPVELPPGDYAVRVLTTPAEVLSGVKVQSAQVKLVELTPP